MRILNLYAGIGGNRKLWDSRHEITAVEINPDIATIYNDLFPLDNVVVGDAHQYLLDHFAEFDFIWSSPPCPTHSRTRFMQTKKIYIDMTLWQEIIFLKTWFGGGFCVECFGLKGEAEDIECNRCFNGWNQDKCKDFTKDKILALAKAYIKRHEQKCKKKDHILDTTKKVTRPNFRKYLRDKIDMKVRVTPELSEELQKICFRENVFWTGGIKDIQSGKEFLFISNTSKYIKSYNIKSESTELLFSQHIECKEYNPETDTLVEKVEEPKPIKTVGIDNSDVALTAQYEPVKDCPVNSEIPQPVKLPDFVYSASKNGVGFIDTKSRTFNTNDKGELLINDKPCFATPEEALQVAKKLWNGDGK